MAVSPADFYAYSRATGVQVPEDPYERAELAPEVRAFRQNQLRAPQQQQSKGPDPLSVGLGVGLALAGGIAGGLGLRKLLRGPVKSATAGVQKVDLGDIATVRRAATENIPAPSKVATPGEPTPGERQRVYAEVATKPTSELPRVYKPSGSAEENFLITDPNTGEIFRSGQSPASFAKQYISLRPELKGQKINLPVGRTPGTFKEFSQKAQQFTPRSYIEKTGAVSPLEDLTSVQQTDLPEVINQKINAVESGLNQQQFKNSIEIQRNEDLDISSAQRFLQNERDEIASQLGEQGLTITPSAIEAELSNRLGKSAYEYGPKYTARKQALELYAQTGSPILTKQIQRFGLSPVTFETFENMPAAKRAGFESAPPFSTSYYPSEELIPVGLTSNINIDVPTRGNVSLASLRKPVIMESTAQEAEDFYQTQKEKALNWLGDLRVQLEPKRNQIFKERRALVEQSAQEIIPRLETARQAGQRDVVQELEQNLENLRILYKNPQLGTHREDELRLLNAQIEGAQSKIAESISSIQKKYPTTISDWSGESARIFGELDVNTGELIPETIEIRGDRPTRETPAKGGGGRNIAEYTAGERLDEEIRAIQGGGRIRDYDETGAAYSPWTGDNTQTGREIDVYGIRPSSEKRADPELRPSQPQYTKEEMIQQALEMSQADLYGDVPVAPEYEKVIESLGSQEPTEARRRSVLLSEQARKGEFKSTPQSIGPYPSMLLLSKPISLNMPQEQISQPSVQLSFSSDVVPATAYAARVRVTPADVAANQLEQYMSKLQRRRATPLTSSVRIQPTLF